MGCLAFSLPRLSWVGFSLKRSDKQRKARICQTDERVAVVKAEANEVGKKLGILSKRATAFLAGKPTLKTVQQVQISLGTRSAIWPTEKRNVISPDAEDVAVPINPVRQSESVAR